MGTAREDFERFVHWMHEPEQNAPEPARRFANLVLANFETVASASRQRHNRSHVLASLAGRELADVNADLPQVQAGDSQVEWPWVRLHHLTLGPFRGFRQPQEFDLSKRIVLCYGPNGSGKSSLCEALEYALLGSVEEAGSKRITNNEYLANIHAGRFVAPVLTAVDADGREVPIDPNADAFRFFFVEKNRIDNFSRIAATPPGRKSDLIATLFGMDQFNEFASHFNESMDAALTLSSQAQAQLEDRRQALRVDEDVVANESEQLAALDRQSADHAAGFAEGLTYQGLKALVGSDESPGRLHELNTRLEAILPGLTSISRERLAELYVNVAAAGESVATARRLLDERGSQISFRDLFAAVQALRASADGHCPACLAPIEEATRKPYHRAEAGLQELAELAAFEEDLQRHARSREEASRALRAELGKLEEFLESSGQQDSIVCTYLRMVPPNPDDPDWWSAVYAPPTDDVPSLEQVLEAADSARAQDVETHEALARRDGDIAEQRRLNDARVWIAHHDGERRRVVEQAEQARTRIAQWQVENAEVIEQAVKDNEQISLDRPIKEAYDRFYELLLRFREQLPGMLMADLNATTMALYNEFNHRDRDEDKLADLELPLTGEGIIEIAFRSNLGLRVNALAALSEGHIRCLGLAILLAKAQSVRAPLIIFDDAINAIDHDHRSGIREAIFESDRFAETQIIVTCHSPEFVKDEPPRVFRRLVGLSQAAMADPWLR